MLSLADFNRASAARIALALDEAASICGDAALILRLARLKDMALDSRAKGFHARKIDRKTLAVARELCRSLKGGAKLWDVLKPLSEIETGLYDRERKNGAASRPEEEKRRLFEQLRAAALEIDWLTARRQKLAEAGAAKKGMDYELGREEFEACSARLRQAQARFEQTRRTLRAMDTVLLMKSEEAGLAALEKYYAAMPDLNAMEENQVRLEMRAEEMQRYNEAVSRLHDEWEETLTALAGMDAPEAPAVSQSEKAQAGRISMPE